MLEVITQERQELKAHDNQRLRVCTPTGDGIPTNVTEEHEDTRCGDLLYPSPYSSPPLESGLMPVSVEDTTSSSGSSVVFGQVPQSVQGLPVSVLESHHQGLHLS